MTGMGLAIAGACGKGRQSDPTPAAMMSAYQHAYRATSPHLPVPEITQGADGWFRITSFGVGAAPIRGQELVAMTNRLTARAKGKSR